ncbi:hemagglutinin repeat-containing protein, partial [Escherichia coli]|uniref:hemagglutinin repeat-containing protein n=1 Tax=Escherichia coli TaxID=562 RepID=UPI0010CCB107
SGWYETHAVAPTVTAGNSLMLSAGRDVNSQAAGIMAENSMDIRAGRDVNMAAESTGTGDHDSTFSMKTVHDSVRQQGTDMTSGGDITVTAGRDITSVATAVTAKGDIRVNAGHDIVLGTATESDYHYSESGETRNRLLSHQTTRTITEDSVTREKGSLLSGNRVTVNAGNNLTVEGSDVVADRDVSLAAGNHVDVLAATSTDTSWRFKETKKSGLMGTGGIGFTIGSSKTTHDRREAGTTQSQSASTIGSTAGNVSITAGKQAHISGSDVIANRDISITGDSVVVDPGHDRRTVDEKFEQKKSGLTVALSGAVGSAINNAATMAREAKETSDSRLAALKGTQAVLSGVQAGVNHGLQQQSADPNNGIGVSISLNHQQSKSETKYQHDIVSGSTLSAGNNVSVTATGKNKDHNNSGDILITGSQIKSGNDTSLNAQNDILLAAAADTRQTTGKNSSKGGGVGVSFGGGTNGGGLSIFAGINGSEGREKGNGTTWTETTVDAGKNVSLTSGHDTTLSGAQVSGEKVTADVGNNLTISSLQDSDRYDSRQNSVAAGGSFTFGSMSGSGYASISQDKIKSNYDSVREQSGIYAGKDGFDVTVGNHTQLNGAVIASTATDDKNSLSTGTLGWSDIHNQADYKASHTGISLSGGSGMSASQMVASNAIAGAANALTGMSGSSGHAEGTTSSAISGGNLIIRNKESQKQDIAGLSRDPENANGSIAPIFDREKEQKRLQEAQVISQISGQMSNIVMTYGETEAMKAARKEHPGMSDAQLRETPEYREVMKGYGTGSTPQMVVQAITGVLGGLNAGNPGQILAGGLNPAVAQLIKQATGDNREANLMAHAVWGALAAQLGGNNAASGAAGAFSGELAARYIIDNYYGGRTDNLSEQERQQISMLATIASGIAGGLAGNSTASAGTGAQAGRNSVENNYLSRDEAAEKASLEYKLKNDLLSGDEKTKAEARLSQLDETDKARDAAIAEACPPGSKGSGACGALVGPAQKALVEYGENVTYSLLYKDLYPQDAKNLETVLQGLDAGSITRDQAITEIAKASGVSWETAASRYDTAMQLQAVTAALISTYGVNGLSGQGKSTSSATSLADKVKENITLSQKARESSNFGQFSKAEGVVQENLGIWPPNRGAYGPVEKVTLPAGTVIDRYGYPGGSFVSPIGVPFEQRALPSSHETTKPYFQYEILKPIDDVSQGKILPWFGQKGQGTQYELPKPVQWYLDKDYIKKVDK